MKFLLKIVALPEGSEISAKIAEKWPKIFRRLPAVNLLLKISKVRKIDFCNFCRNFRPPPLWKSQKFKKKFHFRGRSTSDFSLNWEEFLSFDTLFMAFSKRHFFELSVIFLGRIPPISLPEVEHFLCKIRTFSAIRWLDKRPNGRPYSFVWSVGYPEGE